VAGLSFDKVKKGYRLSFHDADKRKRSIWIGGISEAKANEWKVHVEHLLYISGRGEPPHNSTIDWLSRLKDSEHRKLSGVGLVESRAERMRLNMTLVQWLDTYIGERADLKASTIETYIKARDSLIAYFGKNRQLRSIRSEDAEKWRIWLATKGNRRDKERLSMADATVRRRTGKVKQFFAKAVERGLIDENPFVKLVSTSKPNHQRQFFVPADWIARCIDAAPDGTWRTIIALARYGGLRCPSEVLRLKWSDVSLPDGRMIIHASKTEHHDDGGVRVCPIFPELRPFLETSWEGAPEGAVYVIDRYRSGAVNLRTQFKRIILRAGLKPWPRLMQNLRASRETELMGQFPSADVASWLGNSVPIAMKHYAMATADSFRKAIEVATVLDGGSISGSKCGSIANGAAALSNPVEARKNPRFSEGNRGFDGCCGCPDGRQNGR